MTATVASAAIHRRTALPPDGVDETNRIAVAELRAGRAGLAGSGQTFLADPEAEAERLEALTTAGPQGLLLAGSDALAAEITAAVTEIDDRQTILSTADDALAAGADTGATAIATLAEYPLRQCPWRAQGRAVLVSDLFGFSDAHEANFDLPEVEAWPWWHCHRGEWAYCSHCAFPG